MKHEIVIQLYLKRMRGVYEIRNRCEKGTWCYNYWDGVFISLRKTLDRYLVKEGIFE